MSDLITRKPTATMVELLRRGAADGARGIMTLSDHNDRTQDGILRRDMAEVVPEPGATHSWLVINDRGRAYLAKLDGVEAQQQEEVEVIVTPDAERLEACHYRVPQQAGTHSRAYFNGYMVKVGVRGDGTARRVHAVTCEACGRMGSSAELGGQPCTPEREAEVARLRAITEAPTREARQEAVRGVYAAGERPVLLEAQEGARGGEGQRFHECGCANCSRGRGACVKVPTGPAWGVRRPDGRVVGPYGSHGEALRYARRVVGGGTPVPLEPVA